MPTSKRPARLVVDANPILSALIGGKARQIFFEAAIQGFAVPAAVVEEVRTHLPPLALKVGVRVRFFEYAQELLPLTSYAPKAYQQHLSEARRRIGRRDTDDVDALALTLRLGIRL